MQNASAHFELVPRERDHGSAIRKWGLAHPFAMMTFAGFWLGGLDSNQDSQSQSLESYQLDDLPAREEQKGIAARPALPAATIQPF